MRRLDIYNLQAVDDVSSRYENALSDVEGASDILVAISVLYRNVCHTRRVAKKQFLSFIGIHDFSSLATSNFTSNACSINRVLIRRSGS
jgi:hypothetical protein